MTRRIQTIFATLLAISCSALVLARDTDPPPSATDQPATPNPSDLSVMSFNIRYGTANDGPDSWANRKQLLFDTIAARNPDIAGLQEALRSQLDEIRAALPRHAEVGAGRDDGKTKGEYSAIFFRADRFALADSGTFWFSDTPDVPGSKHWGNGITRICTWARLIETPPNAPNARSAPGSANTPSNPDAASPAAFYVFNLHLDHQSEPSRQRAAEMLATRIMTRAHPEDPVIVTGDFNCGETSPAIRFLTGRSPRAVDDPSIPLNFPAGASWTGLTDTYRAIYPNEPEPATFTAFKLDTPHDGSKIDYIFVTPDAFDVTGAMIDRTSRDGRLPSDHYPVTARLTR